MVCCVVFCCVVWYDAVSYVIVSCGGAWNGVFYGVVRYVSLVFFLE